MFAAPSSTVWPTYHSSSRAGSASMWNCSARAFLPNAKNPHGELDRTKIEAGIAAALVAQGK